MQIKMKAMKKRNVHRLNIDIPKSEHVYLKTLVAVKRTTIKDFVLGLIEKELEKKSNAKTLAAIKELEENKDMETFNTTDELYKDLGI